MSLEDTTKDVTSVVSRQGAWAVLAVGLIVAIGWGLVLVARRGDVLLSDYIVAQKQTMVCLAEGVKSNADATQTVSDAVTTLIEFHDSVSEQHETMIQSLDVMVNHIDGDESRDALASQKLDVLILEMQRANELMSAVPAVRDEQNEKMLAVLDEIRIGIQQLRQELKGCSVRPGDENPENGSG